jgi:hypothetical protein
MCENQQLTHYLLYFYEKREEVITTSTLFNSLSILCDYSNFSTLCIEKTLLYGFSDDQQLFYYLQ